MLTIACASQNDHAHSDDTYVVRDAINAYCVQLERCDSDAFADDYGSVRSCTDFLMDVVYQSYPRACFHEVAALLACANALSCSALIDADPADCPEESAAYDACYNAGH